MILRQRATALLFYLYFLLLLSFSLAGDPSHKVNTFDNLPARIVFFDDTPSVMYFDSVEGNIHVSQDEGKTWELADGIPKHEAIMFIEHPFDNNYAFVLTSGKRHYRTEDRGKTWRPFDVPVKLSLMAKPLAFHAKNPGYILYQGTACEEIGWGAVCHDETYYTREAFSDSPRLLFMDSERCQFAHSSAAFKHEAHNDLIYCVGFDKDAGDHSLSSSRLFSSTDFFETEKKIEDLGIGEKNARGVFAFAIVSKFAVVATKDVSEHSNGDMHLYVTVDTKSWAKAQFPQSSSAQLKENAYTIVESTTHSLAVDVVLHDSRVVGTLFVSNSNGTYFVESLKDTNRNEMGYIDYELIYGVEGVGIANIISNAEAVAGRHAPKQLKSKITFDDGRTWSPLKVISNKVDGSRFDCNTADSDVCSLHLYSVTSPHNFGRVFSSPAPGLVMGVGSVGKALAPYEECDLFLSTDAGLSWKMVRNDAHMYEFGDSGSILVAINDEDTTDHVSYSLDMGNTWQEYQLPARVRAKALVTLPDSTSQKFLLSAQVARKDQTNEIGRFVLIHLDFADTRGRKCGDDDFERWYARAGNSECIMGHRQWYRRRKLDANCYVGEKFTDPVEHEDNCECKDIDFECDFNFIRSGDKCEPAGPEPIPAGECAVPTETYWGSSGWRKIPGNTCEGGKAKDEKVKKKCSEAQPGAGQIAHRIHEFPSTVAQQAYFKKSTSILVRLNDGSAWFSANEGYTWSQVEEGERFVAFYHHPHSSDRAYLLTSSDIFYTTTDNGRSWIKRQAPAPPNTFRAQVLRFHTQSDNLIWVGNVNCEDGRISECHAEAFYSTDNGIHWKPIEKYVVDCAWAADSKLNADPTEIICESYSIKQGSQRMISMENRLELVEGKEYYKKKKKLFDEVVGFAKFSEYLVVAEMLPSRQYLDLQVSLDGVNFAPGMFPPGMKPDAHAYTVLESSTNSLFLHKTMSEPPFPYWGNILKSNSNGTYFIMAAENVNRDDRGYVDFEKIIGLDGIALVNIVSNPLEASMSGKKSLRSKITHNDGSTWKYLKPPQKDSLGNPYPCDTTNCNLHIHGYTERTDPRATYSSPSVVGLIMGVGNVGEELISYTASDTFMSRDGGFTWQEVHKDAHLWEFGDSGSILIMANDERPTDRVLYSTDQGSTWKEYQFTSEDKVRVRVIVTVPEDNSRKFILFGEYPDRVGKAIAVHIDFTSLLTRECNLDLDNPANDDFELWSPSEERSERCLFGRRTLYHRRIKDAQCFVGGRPLKKAEIQENCPCTEVDFECEFNYVKNTNNECVLVPGTEPLADDPDAQCATGADYWYERTTYRKIPYSTCDGGDTKDRGKGHPCPGIGGHSALFWWTIILIPFAFTGLVAMWYYRRSGLARGTIRLPSDSRSFNDSGILATLASVPWFLIGLGGIAYEWVASRVDELSGGYRARRGYRNLPIDEDARILRFQDEE